MNEEKNIQKNNNFKAVIKNQEEEIDENNMSTVMWPSHKP